jgi:hypothetical protein
MHDEQQTLGNDAMKDLNTNTMSVHDKITLAEQEDEPVSGREPEAAAPTSSIQIQQATDAALHFLSHATNETLGACVVGLGATTYLVLGRVGLLLIGVVGGIVLHATWDSHHASPDSLGAHNTEPRKRQELGLEVVQRVFGWNDKRTGEVQDSDDEIKLLSTKKADFASFKPDTAAALNLFTSAIIRDYVK